jgi:hypothetical protein
MKNTKSRINIKNMLSNYNTTSIIPKFSYFSNLLKFNFSSSESKVEETKNLFNTKKSMKTDPHNFNIYGNLKPNFGKPPDPQPYPDYLKHIPAVEPDQQHHFYDVPDSIKFAVKNNYPIIREPVSCYFSSHVNGKTYHVFNAARIVSILVY